MWRCTNSVKRFKHFCEIYRELKEACRQQRKGQINRTSHQADDQVCESNKFQRIMLAFT